MSDRRTVHPPSVLDGTTSRRFAIASTGTIGMRAFPIRQSCRPLVQQDLARFGPTHRRVPQPGRARNRQGASQASSCQTANDGSDKSGMGVPRSIETRNKTHACMALRWNETKKNTVLRSGWEETKEGAALWWRSPDDRTWL